MKLSKNCLWELPANHQHQTKLNQATKHSSTHFTATTNFIPLFSSLLFVTIPSFSTVSFSPLPFSFYWQKFPFPIFLPLPGGFAIEEPEISRNSFYEITIHTQVMLQITRRLGSVSSRGQSFSKYMLELCTCM